MTRSNVTSFIVSEMNKTAERLPPVGTLCFIATPVGGCVINGETSCHSATAYYRDGSWIYADEPTPVRFVPVYWSAIIIKRKGDTCRWGDLLGKSNRIESKTVENKQSNEYLLQDVVELFSKILSS